MPPPPAARRRPPGRYDPPSRLASRALAVLLSVLFFAFVGALAFALFQRFGGDDVRAQVVRYDVRSASAVRIDLRVTKPAGSPAYCIVRSRGRDGAEVGREVVVVDDDGSDQEVLRVSHVLATRARAVSGEAGRCSASPIPSLSPSP